MYYCDKPLTGPIRAPILIYWCYDIKVINTTPTMQNTFKIIETDNPDVSWGEELHLAFAGHRIIELRERYPHINFAIQIHTQIVKSYA
jgi:hypothetical protein